jgi:hypothetical protein
VGLKVIAASDDALGYRQSSLISCGEFVSDLVFRSSEAAGCDPLL